MFWRRIGVVLCCLLLAAHFYRADSLPWMAGALLLPLFTMVHAPWALRLVQAGLGTGMLVWGWTGWRLALLRLEMDRPFLRLALIFVVVMSVTGWCALSLQRDIARYQRDKDRLLP